MMPNQTIENMMNQTIDQDLVDLRFLRQMSFTTEREYRFGEIDAQEYNHVMSGIIAKLEILEVKYGILVD